MHTALTTHVYVFIYSFYTVLSVSSTVIYMAEREKKGMQGTSLIFVMLFLFLLLYKLEFCVHVNLGIEAETRLHDYILIMVLGYHQILVAINHHLVVMNHHLAMVDIIHHHRWQIQFNPYPPILVDI